ncbi:DNA-directed RNA polymerase III subunit 1-like isoform X2 [Amaranthus tricolor]|uniref:DNA-directed RNA polymerase III subunit 1-like isoform X2 n=1 Tax=Amaranthus tricolor TaxID=29722 RepID=UPI00258E1B95|nr:DNA-directed RNA polymerase III subunit 1-like isoform X2 [Amaranthus tricolor]
MAFLLTFSSKCYVSGKLKKGKTALQIVHDRPRENKNDEESGGSTLSFINPHDALLLFKQMLDQDCELLYLNDRPEKLVITNMCVPPLSLRSSVFVDGGIQRLLGGRFGARPMGLVR